MLNHHPTKPFRFVNPQQAHIYKRLLELIGPGPAAFYRDACRLMSTTPAFEATTHFVSHALREIESALRDVILSVTDQEELTALKKQMEGQTHEAEIRAILRGLEFDESEPGARDWLRLAQSEAGLAARSHRDSLSYPPPLDKPFNELWEGMQVVLQSVLDRFEGRYTATLPILEELLKKRIPTDADLTKLKNNVPNNLGTLRYFFERLHSPSWVLPLKEKRFFQEPPIVNIDEDQNTIHLPPWPISEYLLRMSRIATQTPNQLDPDVVVQAALDIPTSQNWRVEKNLADIALTLPSALAVHLVDRIQRGIETLSYQWIDSETPIRLATQLAGTEYGEQALDLVRTLLIILPDPRIVGLTDAAQSASFTPQPQTRLERYYYQQILKKHIPEIITLTNREGLALLCDLLDDALSLAQHPQRPTKPKDYTYPGPLAINEEELYLEAQPLAHLLVAAIRDAVIQLATSDPTQIPMLLQMLKAKEWTIFRRLVLYLLKECGENASTLSVQYLMDRDTFADQGLQLEYNQLAKHYFGRLAPEQQATILDWIAQGPPEAQTYLDDDPIQQAAETIRQIRLWQWVMLSWIAEYLSPDWEKRYEDLVAEFGRPPLNEDIPTRTRMLEWGGNDLRSPQTVAELREMSIHELVAFLRVWQPSDTEGNKQGLASQLNKLALEQPLPILTSADQFIDLDPVYVRAILQAAETVSSAGGTIPWVPILKVCRWAVESPSVVVEAAGFNRDNVWQGIRWSINRLLRAGLSTEPTEFSFGLRQEVWSILRPLTDDPDPTKEQDVRLDDPSTDPFSRAINTIRGQAMDLVILYGLWIVRNSQKSQEQVASTKSGNIEGGEPLRSFAEMPEIRDVLEHHLDLRQEHALAVRAVYGEGLPWLVLMDAEWVMRNLARLFPHDENLQDYYKATWQTYLAYCQPYNDVFSIAHGEYEYAVTQLSATPREGRHPSPDEGLAYHLMAFYWRGLMDLNLDGPVVQFFEKAPEPLRKYALESLGVMLSSNQDALSNEIQNRLTGLWEWRVQIAQTSTQSGPLANELGAFGGWFISSKLDDEWSILQLRQVLLLTGGYIEADSQVMARLEVRAGEASAIVLQCIDLMVNGVKESWQISTWEDHLYNALKAILQAADHQTRTQGIELVNRLVARSYSTYQDLILVAPDQ